MKCLYVCSSIFIVACFLSTDCEADDNYLVLLMPGRRHQYRRQSALNTVIEADDDDDLFPKPATRRERFDIRNGAEVMRAHDQLLRWHQRMDMQHARMFPNWDDQEIVRITPTRRFKLGSRAMSRFMGGGDKRGHRFVNFNNYPTIYSS